MSAHGSKADYFSKQAAQYADPRVRPQYPPALYELVFKFAGPSTDAAVDIACGTGQCAQRLADRYQKVWAVDGSEEQIKHCTPQPNITYRTGLAESTGLPDSSVDLVTVATALHWLDVHAFYKEARRVLKPGGALAAWCYYHPEIKGQPEASRVHAEFCSSVLGPYKEEAHSACERQYAGLEPSSAEFGVVERASLQFEQQSSIMHLVQLLGTAGTYQKMRKANPGAPDPLDELRTQLLSALGTADDSMELTLQYSVFVILAKQPRPL